MHRFKNWCIIILVTTCLLLSCSKDAKSVLEKAENATFVIYTFDEHGSPAGSGSAFFIDKYKVDDEATQILMVEFYKNLMSGKTKHQSLNDAQKHLRQVENGKYDKPEYWTSFIMLDGLN